jgi:5-methylcytosine-specific restriction endonuclease McrA
MAADRRSPRRYRQFRARFLATTTQTLCWLCGLPCDMAQPYRLPGGGLNPAHVTLEHITPLDHGGALMDPANSAIAHRRCQGAQGARIRNAKQAPASRRGPRRNSRIW